ncbi:nuclear transport factor 2 family protein [Nocardia rhamnosiphila]|uniref:Nuclear transport factor 2 family protein n=1 Tax=Nocardia rhamnosiphila TaxID=426716 RepID=A0ABV2WYW5_9NOCA
MTRLIARNGQRGPDLGAALARSGTSRSRQAGGEGWRPVGCRRECGRKVGLFMSRTEANSDVPLLVELEAERDIRRCIADYCEFVDRLDIEGIVSLFSPDATFDYGRGDGRVFTGHDELRRMWTRLDNYAATSHHVSNVAVDVLTHETAKARSDLYAYHVRRSDGSELHLWAQYQDDFRVVDGRWRIQRRVFRAVADKGSVPDKNVGDRLYEFLPRNTLR